MAKVYLSVLAALCFDLSISAAQNPAVNLDPNYRLLRETAPSVSYGVENVTFRRDVAAFQLRNGTISFLPPVLGKVCGAVFTGSGSLTLTPANALEKRYMRFRTGDDTFTEGFDEMLLLFTDDTYEELKRSLPKPIQAPDTAGGIAKWRRTLRRNPESPRTFMEMLISGEDVDNIEAEMLGELYNPSQIGLFAAYVAGNKYKDLRFHIRSRGALQFLPATEEVALFNIDPGEERDGILYLAHLGGALTSAGRQRLIDVKHYSIQTTIAANKRLSAKAEISFTAMMGGTRVIRFSLLPALRVSRVLLQGETAVPFIQEDERADGAFFVLLPEGLQKGEDYRLAVTYEGDKVIREAGGGNFAVGARTSWYPSVNAFTDYATFELTFRVPKRFSLVSVGQLESAAQDGGFTVSRWRSSVPISVAGFSYGTFKKKEITDAKTGYLIEGYANSGTPDYMRGESDVVIAPSEMIEQIMSEAQASIQLYTLWFGPAPFKRLAVTQQPEFNFGQSWPTLVYLPVSAFMDSTQRWMMLGSNTFKFAEFIQEVTPHEVAHQWWGHLVGWSSYRDQWLSEGLSDFSASLFLQATRNDDSAYRTFLKRWTEAILEKNRFGFRANDAGPVADGLRLNTARTPGAYNRVVYAKGGFIVHMLRRMMADATTGDQAFIAMLRDFVTTYSGKTASTEDFKNIAQKHMPPELDLEGNGRLNWFFNQWVYQTAVPSFQMAYSLTPQDGGKTDLRFRITQKDVPESFKSLVSVYVKRNGRVVRLGRVPVIGLATTQEVQVSLPFQPDEVLLNYYYDVLASKSAVERTN